MNGFDLVFPTTGPNDNAEYGLTKRELFAAMAMQGMNAASWSESTSAENVAKWSVSCADALIAALSQETTGDKA